MERILLDEFENAILKLKEKTQEETLINENIINWEKGDDVDLRVNENNKSIDLKLIGRNTFLIKKLDFALLRIKNGTYGQCEECENLIEINRLRARPVATHCMSCKEEIEKTEGQILYEKKSHTHGQGPLHNVLYISNFKKVENDFEENLLHLKNQY